MIKKVLMVAGPVHPIPPFKGAAVETWMYEISKRLIKYEPHIVSISHPCYPNKEYRDGIFFHRIHFSKAYKRLFQKLTRLDPLPYPKRVAQIINEVRPDIIHMHNSIKWFAPLLKLIENRKNKTVLHMHNETIVSYDMNIDVFVGCSEYIVNHFRNTSIRANQYIAIRNGVDLNRFRPYWEVKSLREEIRARFGIRENEFVVLFIGRISPEKGVEHFIKSAYKVDHKDIKFFIIGEISKGSMTNERVRYGKEIIRMAEGLGKRIKIFDVVPHSKIHLFYLLGDIIVVPSNFEEPFSMVTIEAMATGLTVIARNKGGMKEYLKDGVNALIIDEDKIADSIAKKIATLFSNNEFRLNLGRGARKTVEDRFSWNQIVRDVENLYDNLIY